MAGLALYFAAGICADLLATGYTLAVSRGWAWAAPLLSMAITLLNLWVLARVLVVDPSLGNALAYAAGGGLGCFALMRVSKGRKP